jgi:hypothetical protein
MKLVVVGVIVLFLGFWLVQAPGSMATFAQEGASWIWDMLTLLFESVIDFLTALFD